MLGRHLSLALGSAALLLLTPAYAADEPAPGGPSAPANDPAVTADVVSPRLVSDPGARYPDAAAVKGTRERVDVVLVLVVDKTGAVASVEVETPGRAEFDGAAVTAARQLRFTPAMRAGAAISARIRYRYTFEPSAEATPPVAPVPPPVASGEKPSPNAEPAEVTVKGERGAPGVSSIGGGEVRLIPGTFGDPFRAIDTFTGVTPIATGLPFFYIRGSPPGNVGYYLDGVRVPHLFHIGAGPSVVQPAMVGRLDVHKSAYPASFGRYAGGIVSATTKEPRPELHGEASLRLFDVGGFVESGFAGGRGTLLAGGRYSYTGALLSLAAPEIQLDYFDVQARATYDLTPRDRIGVFAFGAYDFLAETENGRQHVQFATEFYRADLRYDRRLDHGNVRTALTLGYDRTNTAFLFSDEPRILTVPSIALRTEVETSLGSSVVLRTGASAGLEQFNESGGRYADPDSPETQAFARTFGPRFDRVVGGYVDFSWEVSEVLLLRPGIRADLYGSGEMEAVAVEPRLSSQVTVARAVRLIAAAGLAHQPPSFIAPIPGVTPRLNGGLQRSIHTTAGVEVDLDEETTTGVSGFYSLFTNMTDNLGTTDGDEPDFENRSHGYAFGTELSLRRRMTARLSGFLSYTLSRSVREEGAEILLGYFDRPHVVSTALSYDLGRGYRIGARALYYSGTPKQPVLDGSVRTPEGGRYPAFFRLDARFEKRWKLGQKAWMAFVVDFLNSTLSREFWPGGERVGPVTIPSIGVEGGL